MEYGLINFIQSAIILILLLYVLFKAYRHRNTDWEHRYFNHLAIIASLGQFMSMCVRLIKSKVVYCGITMQYVVYIVMFIAMVFTAWGAMRYLLYLRKRNELPQIVRGLMFIPCIVMTAAAILSPWTHWLFYIDDALNYHRGQLFFLQLLCPYAFALAAVVIFFIMLARKEKSKENHIFRYFLCFIVPSIIGGVLQVVLNVDGGYSTIGISISVILLYMEFYINEIRQLEHIKNVEEANIRLQGHLEKIENLNSKLKENQTRLEEAATEQKAAMEVVTGLNIELKKQKEELSEAYGMIYALSTDYHSIWVVDKETGRMRFIRSTGVSTINEAVRMAQEIEIFDEGAARYIDTYIVPEDRERMHKAIRFSEVMRQLSQSDFYSVNYLRIDENGSVGYHQVAFANADTAEGKRQFVYGFRDIDAIVKKEQEQQKILQSQLDLVNALSRDYLNVYVVNPETKRVQIIKLNGYVTKGISLEKTDYQYDELCKQYIENRVYADDVDMMTGVMDIHNIMDNLKNDGDYVGTYRVLDEGEIHYYQYKYVKLSGTENIIAGFQNVDQMIAAEKFRQTQLQKALAEAERANNAKTVFLNNMSHDIRTPMNAVLGYTELMERYAGDKERFYDYLGKIRKSGDFLLSLINNVLEMARIESGEMTLDEEPCISGRVTEEITSVYSELMKLKNIEFIQSVDIRTPYIYADRTKLNEIFLNLVSNAYKYTPEGGRIQFSIIELPCSKPGYVVIQALVSDNGIGMSEEYQKIIFEEFSRERNAAEAKIPGTGLGMAIVKKLVDLMNGSITVESELGKGTTFVVKVEHRIADSPKEYSDSESPVVKDDGMFTGKRLLIAEDNEFNAEIASELLSGYGFETEHAADGIICVEMLSKAAPGYYDAILMDIQMPNMDGYHAAQSIRALPDKEKAGIPIFAMTADAFEEDKKKAIDSGMNGHFAKPIDVAEIIRTLSVVLK